MTTHDKRLKDHPYKCRVCFKRLIYSLDKVEVTRSIEERFQFVAQMHLVDSPKYSNEICLNCDLMLRTFSEFKRNIVQWQQELYKNHPDYLANPEHFLYIGIKKEDEESDDNFPSINEEVEFEDCKRDDEPVNEQRVKVRQSNKGGRKPNPSRRLEGVCDQCGEKMMQI
jgi:hypothetical protein